MIARWTHRSARPSLLERAFHPLSHVRAVSRDDCPAKGIERPYSGPYDWQRDADLNTTTKKKSRATT